MFDSIITGYRWIFLQMASVLGPGWAIVALSFICSALMAPLMKAVGGIVRRESDYQSVINPQLDAIKAKFASDMDRHFHIQRLYSRYSYSPLSAVKKVLPLFVQIPFLLLTYYMLKGTEELAGVSFLFLSDLGQPDAMIAGTNLLPVIMTAVNILTVFATPDFSHKDWVQAIGIALLFLVLLYSAPSALLLYWTLNNVITFIRTLFEKKGAGVLLLQKRVYSLPMVIIRRMHAFCSQENAAWGVFVTFIASGFLALTWHGILSLTDTNGGLTQFVSIRGTLPLIACSATLSMCLAFMSKSQMRGYASFLLILVAVFIVGLHGLVVFNYNLFKLFFALVNAPVLILILLCTIAVANILVSKREKDSATKAFIVGSLREWAGGCVIIAFGWHYAFSSDGFILNLVQIFALIFFMILPVLVTSWISILMFSSHIGHMKLIRFTIGAYIGLYAIPLFTTGSGVLAYDKNIFLRLLSVFGVASLFAFVRKRGAVSVFSILLSVVLVGNAICNALKAGDSSNVPKTQWLSYVDMSCIRTNNIYLLIYDAYANRIIREHLLEENPDISIERFLEKNGFSNYDSYSVGAGTLESMGAFFMLNGESGGSPRSMMTGDNLFSDYLSHHGYRTSYILCGYDMPNKGERMPGDFYFPNASKAERPQYVLYGCIMRGYMSQSPQVFNDYTRDEWLAAKYAEFSRTGKKFIYAHSPFPGHAFWAPNGRKSDEEEISAYKRRLLEANAEIMHDVEYVIAHDPSAIVIVAGDHGGFLLSPDKHKGVDARHLLDRHGMLLSIRWPDAYQPNETNLVCFQNVLVEVLQYMTGDTNVGDWVKNGETHAMKWPMNTKKGLVVMGTMQDGADKGKSLFEVAHRCFENIGMN